MIMIYAWWWWRRSEGGNKQRKNLILGFPGSLQPTPLTRIRAPRIHVEVGGNWVNYRVFLHHVGNHSTLPWNLSPPWGSYRIFRRRVNSTTPLTKDLAACWSVTPPTRSRCSVDDDALLSNPPKIEPIRWRQKIVQPTWKPKTWKTQIREKTQNSQR